MIPKIRKDKQYRITIEDVGMEEARTLVFEYQDREDLFKIVEGLKRAVV